MTTADLSPVQFAIVKYVPDPLRDEPVNIGVVGMVAHRLILRSIPKYGRVKRASGVQDTDPLDTALRFLRSALDRSSGVTLTELASSTFGIIRFGEVQGGLTEDPIDFIDDLYERYVGDVVTPRAQNVTRQTIRHSVRNAIASKGIDSHMFSIWKRRFQGASGRHEFDFGSENGAVTLLRGISLQTEETYALRDARELSLAAIDSKRMQERIDRDVVVIAIVAPSTEPGDAYDEAFGLVISNVDHVAILASDDENSTLNHVFGGPHSRPISRELLVDPPAASVAMEYGAHR
jgi:hypothetical protein